MSKVKLTRNNAIITQLIVAALMVIVMMVFGVLMLLQQGGIVDFGPAAFYQFLTIHGTGMIGTAALATAGIMWYFLSHYVKLSPTIIMTTPTMNKIKLVFKILFESFMWYFLSHYVKLSKRILKTNLILFIVGVVMIIVGVFAFDYSSSWTLLY